MEINAWEDELVQKARRETDEENGVTGLAPYMRGYANGSAFAPRTARLFLEAFEQFGITAEPGDEWLRGNIEGLRESAKGEK